MKRRAFLKALGWGGAIAAAAAAGIVDPEHFLWTPGAKTIVLPPMGGWPNPTLFNPPAHLAEQYRESITLRYVKHYDVATTLFQPRFDVLYGMAVIDPKYAVILTDVGNV